MATPAPAASETLARLHDFGMLFAFQVRYLNKITRDISSLELSHKKLWTFNEDLAKSECDLLVQSGIDAWVVSIAIGFDGAWSGS